MTVTSRDREKSRRLRFGPNKYYALNLMLARWLRHHARQKQSYHYVTLGGTELRDIVNANWIDKLLVNSVVSYEKNKENLLLAQSVAAELTSRGVRVSLAEDDIFSYRRQSDDPHVFYMDL